MARRPDRVIARLRNRRERTVPGGAGWRYVFGPGLMAVILVQAFTGVLLMTSYSPSTSSRLGQRLLHQL